MVFSPSLSVTVVLNEPSSETDTGLPLTVSVTGAEVSSFVVPETTQAVEFV